MEVFKSAVSAARRVPAELLSLVKVGKRSMRIVGQDSGAYAVYTYTVNTGKRHRSDDEIYAKHPQLVELLPRACSIVCATSFHDGKQQPERIVGTLMGMRKFTGPVLSEDPDEGDTATTIADQQGAFETNTIQQWAAERKLCVLRTSKENGKMAILRLMRDPVTGQLLIVGGSKNYHIVTCAERLQEWCTENKHVNQIMAAIFTDIQRIWPTLGDPQNPVHELMVEQGYSLAGELCDGQHFTEGDGKIHWFGLFREGLAMEPQKALPLLRGAGFLTVDFEQVYGPDSPPKAAAVESMFRLSRCMDNEGSVLYCTNTDTGETILYKSKSVMYIVKRFMRQVILRGYANLQDIQKRFVDAAEYHGLNTEASVRITRQLYAFGFWMMNKDYPTKVLNVIPVQAVRGSLPNGFALYWKEYRAETGDPEIVVTEQDFDGSFDAAEYLQQTALYPDRDPLSAPVVVFLQGLQGSGKSTLGALLRGQVPGCKIVEQDVCWGDTLAAQGQLYHYASDGKTPLIVVTRCNVNPSQYKTYLGIAHERNCRVLFLAPTDISPLYFAISFAGIFQRSAQGDSLLVGRHEMPMEEVYDFVSRNYKEMQVHRDACRFKRNRRDDRLLEEAQRVYLQKREFLDFVQQNREALLALRVDMKEVVAQMLVPIREAMQGQTDRLVRPSFVLYVSLQSSAKDRAKMLEFAKQQHASRPIMTANKGKQLSKPNPFLYSCDHVTQAFLGKTKSTNVPLVPPFEHVSASVDYAVLRESDGALAFHVQRLVNMQGEEVKVDTGYPHITGRIPEGMKPRDAIQLMVNQDQPGYKQIPFTLDLDLVSLHQGV